MTGENGKTELDTLRMWMSAFVDGELDRDTEALLMAALEEHPALVDELAAMGAVSWATAGDIDVADAVMAQIAPAGVDDGRVLMSQALDGALTDAGTARLVELMRGGDGAEDFAHLALAARATLETAALVSGVDVAAQVAAVLADDKAAQELAAALLDGEAVDRPALVQLLTDETHAAARQEAFLSLVAQSDLVAALGAAYARAPEAQKAAAAALSAIEKHTQNEARASAHARPAAPTGGWFSRLFGGLRPVGIPLAFASAAAAAFFFVGGEPAPESWEPSADVRTLAVATDLTLLRDNHSDVQSIQAGVPTTAVFETDASNITIIWVGEPEEQDT